LFVIVPESVGSGVTISPLTLVLVLTDAPLLASLPLLPLPGTGEMILTPVLRDAPGDGCVALGCLGFLSLSVGQNSQWPKIFFSASLGWSGYALTGGGRAYPMCIILNESAIGKCNMFSLW